MLRARRLCHRHERGLSLVELMVGIAIGLFVVAGATLVVSTQLGDNRRLLLETQLQQDLRATADIISREIRRAGFWTAAAQGVWHDETTSPLLNPYRDVTLAGAPSGEVQFSYRRGPGVEGPFGFRLQNGTIRSLIGDVWQELTDPAVMQVTAFTVKPVAGLNPIQVPCPKDCDPDPAVDDTSCWPELTVRAYTVDITARSVRDVNVQRSIRSTVRLRNDVLNFNAAEVCPP